MKIIKTSEYLYRLSYFHYDTQPGFETGKKKDNGVLNDPVEDDNEQDVIKLWPRKKQKHPTKAIDNIPNVML